MKQRRKPALASSTLVERSRFAARTEAGLKALHDLSSVDGLRCLGFVADSLTAGQHTGWRCDQRSTSTCYAYKKSSPHASLNAFADDLKLLTILPRTEQAYYAWLHPAARVRLNPKLPDSDKTRIDHQICFECHRRSKTAPAGPSRFIPTLARQRHPKTFRKPPPF